MTDTFSRDSSTLLLGASRARDTLDASRTPRREPRIRKQASLDVAWIATYHQRSPFSPASRRAVRITEPGAVVKPRVGENTYIPSSPSPKHIAMSESTHAVDLVTRLSPDLTGKQRRHLRGLGHDLRPIVFVGQKGISDNLLDNLKDALNHHELVKVKVHDADDMEEAAERIHQATGAQLAQRIGKNLLFYLAHPDHPQIRLPRSASS